MDLTSSDIKTMLVMRFSGIDKWAGAVEEVSNTWNADVVALKWDGEVCEFEIKVSRSDLLGEIKAIKAAAQPGIVVSVDHGMGLYAWRRFYVPNGMTKLSETKIIKHHHYRIEHHISRGDEIDYMPHKFYFALPSKLVPIAVEHLKGIKEYGIYDVETKVFVKKAFSLHKGVISRKALWDIMTRSFTEKRQLEGSIKYYRDREENGVRINVKVIKSYTPMSATYMKWKRENLRRLA